MPRLFTALNIPPLVPLRRVASALRQIDPRLRVESPERWHITLNFLGEVDEERIPHLIRQLSEVTQVAERLTFVLQGLGVFPDLQRPRVFWAGTGAAESLRALQQRLQQAVQSTGLPASEGFAPHLTLARVRARPVAGIDESLEEYAKTFFGNVQVHEVFLYQSNLHQPGRPYQVRAQFPLGNATNPGK
jgi:2'-5' RNA ligase